MADVPADIFTETEDIDPDTLANLGPLRALAGVWEGRKGKDVNPKAAGPDRAWARRTRESRGAALGPLRPVSAAPRPGGASPVRRRCARGCAPHRPSPDR